MPKKWFEEVLYKDIDDKIGYRQAIKNDGLLVAKESKYQNIEIFFNHFFGEVLLLDGVVQTTSKDEKFYHEMFVHVPVFSHGKVKRVLIIGGGDGGILREVLRHKIDYVKMVEIDADVISLCKQYMPHLSEGAFDDNRADVQVGDGINYIKTTEDKFDLIIVDSTDPMGCGEPLFTEDFYIHAKRCLNKGGVFASQSGVPFFQPQELENIHSNLSKIFNFNTFYTVPVPTYVGGCMCLSFATDNKLLGYNSIDNINNHIVEANIGEFSYYNAKIHVASFYLPEYIYKIIKP